MKLDIRWGDAARFAGGRLVSGSADDFLDSISTDTRTIKNGEAFWALQGEKYDAHAFLDAKLSEKASGWVVEESKLPKLKPPLPPHLIAVPNSLRALQALAAHHRKRFDIPVIGVTGSNGKTTTKEMIKSIFSELGPVCASPGNWNNQIGVPLSVLNLDSSHRWAVFELADSHPGDIKEISQIAQPTIAVFTNIGPDHIEFYGSMEANFKTKLELLDSLPQDASVIINGDDPWLSSLEGRLGGKAVTFGEAPLSRVRFSNHEIIIDRHKIVVHLKAFGKLSQYNAAAAAAVAWALGINPDTIRAGLEKYQPSAMRMEKFSHPGGCEVVLDAYNANPASMKASIESFIAEFHDKKKILVLGDMKELGEQSRSFHAELGDWIATLPVSEIYLAGPEMKAAAESLSRRKPPLALFYKENPSEWVKQLKKSLEKNSACLFKASRAMKFENVYAAIFKPETK